MKNVRNFIINSRFYLIILLILFIFFYLIESNYSVNILEFDNNISNFIQSNIVKDELTTFFKVFTNMGGMIVFVVIILLSFLIFKNKKYASYMTFNLLITFMFSVIFKNVFMRERPLYSLIEKPADYSFPSGHTMCSMAFYGFIIYLISKYVKNRFLKWFLIVICVITIVLVGFSRIYLNVHFCTDVICGAVLGLVCLLMFVNYVKIKDVI